MVKEKPINTTSSPSTEVKKMKQGMSYSSKEKTIIMNVFKYFRCQNPEKNVTEIIRRTSKATGCSEKSIFSFRKEEHSPQGFKEPSKTKIRKKLNINSRLNKYNDTIRESIKNAIYDLKQKNITPSLNVILKSLNANSNIPKFSLMTLRRLLSDMGFYYEKNGNKSVLVERNQTVRTIQSQPIDNGNCSSKFNQNQTNNDKIVTRQVNMNNQLHADVRQETTPLVKIDNSNNSHQMLVQQHYKSPVVPHYGHTHENNVISMNVNSSPHISMMFTPRMPPYHIHSTLQPPFHHNKEAYLKDIPSSSSTIYHPSQLGIHNSMLH